MISGAPELRVVMWNPSRGKLTLMDTCPHGLMISYRPAEEADGLDAAVRRGLREGKAEMISQLMHGRGGVESYPVPSPKAVSWWIRTVPLRAAISECADCASDVYAISSDVEAFAQTMFDELCDQPDTGSLLAGEGSALGSG